MEKNIFFITADILYKQKLKTIELQCMKDKNNFEIQIHSQKISTLKD